MGLWDEQDGFGSFPLSIRTEKVPRAGGGLSPCKQSPRIIYHYAPIATASRQTRQARWRRSPCRRSAMLCPCCCFCRSALTEQGAKTIAYNQSKNESKRNKRASKKGNKTSTKKEKQKQIRSGDYIKIPNKQKEKQVITYKQDKEKSKRDPRKAYKQTSRKEKERQYYSPLCLYIE